MSFSELACLLGVYSANQVDSNASSDQIPRVDVYGVAPVLCYLCQTCETSRHAKGKHQQWLQQLGCAAYAGIEVHLQKDTHRSTKDSRSSLNTKDMTL